MTSKASRQEQRMTFLSSIMCLISFAWIQKKANHGTLIEYKNHRLDSDMGSPSLRTGKR